MKIGWRRQATLYRSGLRQSTPELVGSNTEMRTCKLVEVYIRTTKACYNSPLPFSHFYNSFWKLHSQRNRGSGRWHSFPSYILPRCYQLSTRFTMFFKTYLSSAGLLFCLNQLSQAAAVDPCTLYAYGTNIDGLPVFYMNCESLSWY
jgi:hypothetical protein